MLYQTNLRSYEVAKVVWEITNIMVKCTDGLQMENWLRLKEVTGFVLNSSTPLAQYFVILLTNKGVHDATNVQTSFCAPLTGFVFTNDSSWLSDLLVPTKISSAKDV